MTSDAARTEGDGTFVERASMEASFTSIKRTALAGLFTAVIVVGGLLLSGGASWTLTIAMVLGMVATRLAAVWTAVEGLQATCTSDQRVWTTRLEYALVPMGLLSGLAPSLLPMSDGRISPEWFGLMVCSVAVVASNVLLGYGRSRTLLALAAPLVVTCAFSAILVGGAFAMFFAPGAVVVGAILILDNREAGALFREARRLQEQNRVLVRELRDANAQLEEKVHTDALTGLSNRSGLRRHIESLSEADIDVEVIYVDLDGFKSINDVHGHAAGDAVLAAIGERLSRIVRSEDCAARLGGDEFAIIAPAAGLESRNLSGRVHDTIVQPITVGESELVVGASIGSKVAPAGSDIGLAVRMADAAMYDQKRDARRPNLPATTDQLDVATR